MEPPSRYTFWLFLPPRPKGTLTEEGASLVMCLLGGFPNPWRATFKKSVARFSFSSLLSFLSENVHFGRSLAQLTLAALSLYPVEAKESPERHVFSDVPFCRFPLATYPSVGFAASGPSWPFWAALGLDLAS